MNLLEQAAAAKEASRGLRGLPCKTRDAVLEDFATRLVAYAPSILSANGRDCAAAREAGMPAPMLERLALDEGRIEAIADGVRQVAALPDPLGRVLEERELASGVLLRKVSCPIGVIGVIFESRPNVSADCMALALKAGSACVLKGGKESYESCAAIVATMKETLSRHGVATDAVMLGERPGHAEANEFMQDRAHVDLLVPRGSKRLIDAVVEHAKVPVIETGAGICHVYVDASADLDMAQRIVVNAKCSRPSVCNAMETLLVDEAVADAFVPRIVEALAREGVAPIHADARACELAAGACKADACGSAADACEADACGSAADVCEADVRGSAASASNSAADVCVPADEGCWGVEYDALEMNLRVVDGVQAAIDHIEAWGTHHSECIVSETPEHVRAFMEGCDSACVYHNASTRFTDGFEFGLGAEIGISTQKLHARGPMGLAELTTYCYRLEGHGETR